MHKFIPYLYHILSELYFTIYFKTIEISICLMQTKKERKEIKRLVILNLCLYQVPKNMKM